MMASRKSTGTSLDQIDDVELSLKGMTFLLNNDWEDAKQLFAQYKEDSALMCAGDAMVTFMQALMTFEDDQLATAMKVLQEVKKKCETSKSFTLSRMKKSGGGKKKKSCGEVEDKLQRQIIIADCVIYQAVLTFLNQDISSYIKGGWMLRKAYKMYDKLYKEINKVYKKYQLNESAPANASPTKNDEIEHASEAMDALELSNQSTPDHVSNSSANRSDADSQTNNRNSAENDSLNDADNDQITVDLKDGTLSREATERLFGAVSFGYGTFQLAISLIPPKILKIIEFLGFEGDRETGLESLEVASRSCDMKAPLASLGLIWYHTVIRPFFALDGTAVAVGVPDAYKLIARSEERYPNSALFLFFKGRAQRLTAELEKARDTYMTALKSCAGQREIELICYHELGWIAMMQMDWAECARCFTRLKEESRWSKSYYAMLTGLSIGASDTGDLAKARAYFEEAPRLVRRKNNQIEAFVLKRTGRLMREGGAALSHEQCTLTLLEILYLWNSISQCTAQGKASILTLCDGVKEQSLFHLRDLIAGSLYNSDGNSAKAQEYFRSAISRQEELSKAGNKEDTHVCAFAMYELGIMLASEPQTYEEGRAMLVRARDSFKEYDFDNRLSVRINAALRRIRQEGTPL